MLTNLKFFIGAVISLPLLPFMYLQGKRIRASVPKLPEATGVRGIANVNAKKTVKLIALGESTIAGVGVATHKEGFTGALAKELASLINVNIDWKVYARSGYTAQSISRKIVPKIQEEKADLIVIGLGGNDAFTLSSPKKWRKNIEKLIGDLHKKYPKATIVFCNMPPIKEFPAFTPLIKFTIGNLVELLGQELTHLVKKHQNIFYFGETIRLKNWIDKIPTGAKKVDFFSDGMHPSKLTYQTWAKDIATNISNNIDVSSWR